MLTQGEVRIERDKVCEVLWLFHLIKGLAILPILVVLSGLGDAARAGVPVFEERFDDWSADTTLTGLPAGRAWTLVDGQDLEVNLANYLASSTSDRAIDGSTGGSPYCPYSHLTKFIGPPKPGTALYTLTYEAYATGGTYNSGMTLGSASGTSLCFGWWAGWPSGFEGSKWGFDARAVNDPTTPPENSTAYENLQEGVGFGEPVEVAAFLDVTNREVWGTLTIKASGTTYTTAKYLLAEEIDPFSFDSLKIWECYSLYGYGDGLDVDDIIVVPEPVTLALLALGGAALAARRRKG